MSDSSGTFSAAAGRRKYHFHLPGVLYTAITLLIAIGAINSQNNLLFWTLGLAIAALLVSGVLSGPSLMGLRIEREAIEPGKVGEPLRIRYAVTNTNRIAPAFGLTISEVEARGREKGTRRAWGHFFKQPMAFVPHIGPRSTVHVEAVVTPFLRGQADLNELRILTTFPFGLTKKSVTFASRQSVLVCPRVFSLRPGLGDTARSRGEAGQSERAVSGHGQDFFGLRDYVPGDSLRSIAWRASARTGELVVRQHSAPSPRRVWVVLRVGSEIPDPLDLEKSISLVASLIDQAHEAGASVGLAVPQAGLLHGAHQADRHVQRLMNELGALRLEGHLEDAQVPQQASKGDACIVVHASSFDPGWGPSLAGHLDVAQFNSFLADSSEAGAFKPGHRRHASSRIWAWRRSDAGDRSAQATTVEGP